MLHEEMTWAKRGRHDYRTVAACLSRRRHSYAVSARANGKVASLGGNRLHDYFAVDVTILKTLNPSLSVL